MTTKAAPAKYPVQKGIVQKASALEALLPELQHPYSQREYITRFQPYHLITTTHNNQPVGFKTG